MLWTAEVRWFYPGPAPPALQDWFDRFAPEPEPARDDSYLRPTDAALNIKRRAGALEIKRRDGAGQTVSLHPKATGRLEYWCKWTFPLEDDTQEEEGPPFWLTVHKERRMIKLGVDDEHQVIEQPGGEHTQGCEVELSHLTFQDHTWWSLCFEATGSEQALLAAAAHLFSREVPHRLALDHSCGYTDWLMDM